MKHLLTPFVVVGDVPYHCRVVARRRCQHKPVMAKACADDGPCVARERAEVLPIAQTVQCNVTVIDRRGDVLVALGAHNHGLHSRHVPFERFDCEAFQLYEPWRDGLLVEVAVRRSIVRRICFVDGLHAKVVYNKERSFYAAPNVLFVPSNPIEALDALPQHV